MNIRKLLNILALLLILASVILLPQFLSTNGLSANRDNIENISVNCSLNEGACSYSSVYFGAVTVAVEPTDFPAFKPLRFAVHSSLNRIEKASVSLEGKDMYMGPNTITLVRGSNNEWSGSGIIPLCSVDSSMVWLVKVLLEGSGTQVLTFEVNSSHG